MKFLLISILAISPILGEAKRSELKIEIQNLKTSVDTKFKGFEEKLKKIEDLMPTKLSGPYHYQYVDMEWAEVREELKKFAAEHDFYLSKRSVYHGKSGEATFAIRGEIDPEWGRPWADARRVPDTVYARSETSGYSLHASQAATEQLAEVWLPRIRAAMDCKERHRKTITEIFEE